MKLLYQYMAIFFIFQNTSNHLHPLQVENCDSNSRLVVDEDDNGKFRPERVTRARNTDSKLLKPSETGHLSINEMSKKMAQPIEMNVSWGFVLIYKTWWFYIICRFSFTVRVKHPHVLPWRLAWTRKVKYFVLIYFTYVSESDFLPAKN